MKPLKDAFNKASLWYHGLSIKQKFAGFAAVFGAAALSAEMLIIPAAMSGRLDRDMRAAVAANDGQKVESLLHSHYAPAMWGGSDDWGNNQRKYLGERLCDASKAQNDAAIDAILKNNPRPYDRTGRYNDSLFFFVSHVGTTTDTSRRDCSFGEALRQEDTKALDAYLAHDLKAGENYGELDSVIKSKVLVEYFLTKHPDKIVVVQDRNSYYNERAPDTLLSYMVTSKAPLENVLVAIEHSDVRGTYEEGSKKYKNQPLFAAIAATRDGKDGVRQDGIVILSALLKKGAEVNAEKWDYYEGHPSPLLYSLRRGTADSTKMLIEAGADVDAALRAVIEKRDDPYSMAGWDDAVKRAASDEMRAVLAAADQQRELEKKLPKKGPGPR